MNLSSSSSSSSDKQEKGKRGLGWMEWARGWLQLIYEMLFQSITASHLENPMPLPPLNDITCIVTGSTNGIGLQIARQLAEAGAHIVMAVRNPKNGQVLVQKWQSERSGMGLPLNVDVCTGRSPVKADFKYTVPFSWHIRVIGTTCDGAQPSLHGFCCEIC